MLEPAAESCTTTLFLKVSVFLKTMKLTSSTIINKILRLPIIFPNIEEKQIRNLKSQNIIRVWLKKPSFGELFAVVAEESTLTCQIYVKECLQKRLLPLIKSNDSGPVFWRNLASCNYCKLDMKNYEQKDVNFVPKTENPPNCPELRVLKSTGQLLNKK